MQIDDLGFLVPAQKHNQNSYNSNEGEIRSPAVNSKKGKETMSLNNSNTVIENQNAPKAGGPEEATSENKPSLLSRAKAGVSKTGGFTVEHVAKPAAYGFFGGLGAIGAYKVVKKLGGL